MPHLSSHAILLPHFGFSHLSLSGCSLFLWKLLLFCTISPSLSPSHYWPRIFLNSLIWTTPLSLENWLMDKARETLASSSLSLPLATLCLMFKSTNSLIRSCVWFISLFKQSLILILNVQKCLIMDSISNNLGAVGPALVKVLHSIVLLFRLLW